jgi:beta-galactosidase/beta-glucuronidase
LLVWQEFIFACSQYPVNEKFLSLVRTEVAQQATRLSKYSSIVMWSANNENNVYNTGPSAAPYRTLYSHSILDVLVQFDSSRPLWPSSPAQGFLSGVDNNGLPNREPFVLDERITTPPRGDTHYYNYFSCPDVGSYPRTHFASEFGFQSLPWQENLEPVSEMVDWSIFSPFMEHRQHHPNGNSEIAELLLRNFFNNSKNASVITSLPFSRLIYLSQLQQSLCVVDQISFYRRGRDYPEYRSMGALFWQLNQNWQAPSWTSIEYGGEWKVLHYGVRHAFETVHISSFVESGNLFLHVTNDHDFTLFNVAVQIFSVRYSDGKAWALSTTRTNITHRSGEFVWSERLNPRWDSFLWAVVSFANVTKTHYLPTTTTFGENISTNCSRFFDISVKSIAFNKATLNVNLVAKHVVTYIFIRSVRHCRGKFSNNLFHLIPCSTQPCVEASASIQLEFANPQNENIGDKNSFLASLAIECK